MRKLNAFTAVVLLLLFLVPATLRAQLSVQAQLRTRSEMRDGFANLNTKGASAAFLVSQRARLTADYKWERLRFNFSIQDVRVWGQDASSISTADGSRLMVHEAWAEVIMMNAADTGFKSRWIDFLSLRIGRQALLYDDARLLGDLDWLQQGRRHDAAVLRSTHKGWQVDLGAGFNQNNENPGNTGTHYVAGNVPPFVTNSNGLPAATPPGLLPLAPGGSITAKSSPSGMLVLSNAPGTNGMNQFYKSMQFLYVSRKFGGTKFSGLFFKDDFSKYRYDSIGTPGSGYIYGRRYDVRGVNSRLTYGLLASGTLGKSTVLTTWTAGAYWQSGKDKDGKVLHASHYTTALSFKKGKFSTGPGFDYLSGNSIGTRAASSHRFDPLYGTPHKFWGYMDYFYAGSGSAPGGLKDAYWKNKYTSGNFSVLFDIHHFSLANSALNTADPAKPTLSQNLGFEFDCIANYRLNAFSTIEGGYCFMAASNSLEYVKKGTTGQTNHLPQWGYLMINIHPDILTAKRSVSRQ